jgi:hypothetical protein
MVGRMMYPRSIITVTPHIVEGQYLQKRMEIGIYLKRQAQARTRSHFQQSLPLKRTVIQTITQNHLVLEMINIPDGEYSLSASR